MYSYSYYHELLHAARKLHTRISMPVLLSQFVENQLACSVRQFIVVPSKGMHLYQIYTGLDILALVAL